MTYVMLPVGGGELQALMRQRQCIIERMKHESQVGAVLAHSAPVDASIRRTTLAYAQYTTSGDLHSAALPDDVAVGTPAPDHSVAPGSSTYRAEDADGSGRDDGGDTAADLQRDEVARRHQHELRRLADDRRPPPPPSRPRSRPCWTVAELARLLRRRLGRFPVNELSGSGSGEAVRVGNRRDCKRCDLLLAANLSLLNPTTARRRTLFTTTDTAITSLSSNEQYNYTISYIRRWRSNAQYTPPTPRRRNCFVASASAV